MSVPEFPEYTALIQEDGRFVFWTQLKKELIGEVEIAVPAKSFADAKLR
jgi:hypothetical protein